MGINMEKKYFAASNSGEGFVSYYPQIFDKIPTVYVIKGGPGTGKNRMMDVVAKKAVSDGADVEYFYCSSDPASLDGIIINSSVAMADGTAPHVYEPLTVGAHENILNIGQFWDNSVLQRQRDIIEYLCMRKKESFSRAYDLLSAALKIESIKKSVVFPYINYEKIGASVERICTEELLPSGEGIEDIRLCNSIGMSGIFRLPTYEMLASRIYCIVDFAGIAGEYFAALKTVLSQKKADLYLSYDPINPRFYDAICERSTRCTFCKYTKDEQTKLLDNEELCERICSINTQKFIDYKGWRFVRDEWSRLDKLQEEIMSMAEDEMRKISNYHFAVEEIYSAAMDFTAKEAFTEEFIKKISY